MKESLTYSSDYLAEWIVGKTLAIQRMFTVYRLSTLLDSNFAISPQFRK